MSALREHPKIMPLTIALLQQSAAGMDVSANPAKGLELCRQAKESGAEVILTPNACTLEEHRLGQFKARAYENMVALAMTNYPAPHCNGHSIAVDPVCFCPEGTSRNTVLTKAHEEEGIFLARFDLEGIRAYRRREPWGNAYRRPERYTALTSREIHEPFIRPGATR